MSERIIFFLKIVEFRIVVHYSVLETSNFRVSVYYSFEKNQEFRIFENCSAFIDDDSSIHCARDGLYVRPVNSRITIELPPLQRLRPV